MSVCTQCSTREIVLGKCRCIEAIYQRTGLRPSWNLSLSEVDLKEDKERSQEIADHTCIGELPF